LPRASRVRRKKSLASMPLGTVRLRRNSYTIRGRCCAASCARRTSLPRRSFALPVGHRFRASRRCQRSIPASPGSLPLPLLLALPGLPRAARWTPLSLPERCWRIATASRVCSGEAAWARSIGQMI
jgi:hypothetical protein